MRHMATLLERHNARNAHRKPSSTFLPTTKRAERKNTSERGGHVPPQTHEQAKALLGRSLHAESAIPGKRAKPPLQLHCPCLHGRPHIPRLNPCSSSLCWGREEDATAACHASDIRLPPTATSQATHHSNQATGNTSSRTTLAIRSLLTGPSLPLPQATTPHRLNFIDLVLPSLIMTYPKHSPSILDPTYHIGLDSELKNKTIWEKIQ
jgi:hypothetical protein